MIYGDQNITASLETLIDQAPKTTREFFRRAVETIDEQFHVGYAQNHPELVAALVQASSRDLQSSMIDISAQKIAEALAQ